MLFGGAWLLAGIRFPIRVRGPPLAGALAVPFGWCFCAVGVEAPFEVALEAAAAACAWMDVKPLAGDMVRHSEAAGFVSVGVEF